MLRQWLIKLEWFSTLFPRIPVPIQQKLQKHLTERFPNGIITGPKVIEADPPQQTSTATRRYEEKPATFKGGDGSNFLRDRSRGDFDTDKSYRTDRTEQRYRGGHDYDRVRERSRERDRSRDRERSARHHHSGSSSSKHRDRHRDTYDSSERSQERSRERERYSREREHSKSSKSHRR